jgi:hypothetical protein
MRNGTALIPVLVLAVTGLPGAVARATPMSPGEVPEPLRTWVPWVLHDHEEQLCPAASGDEKQVCAWAGRLELKLDDHGGHFTQEWQLVTERQVPLPGDSASWPLDLKVDGKAAIATAEESDEPTVRMQAGHHTVTGAFVWRRLPDALPVPSSTGVLELIVRGHLVEFPNRSESGELFLNKEAAEVAEEDRLDITVHRRLTDDAPLLLTTRLALNVAGKTREVVLGRSLPDGFVPHALESPLPARIEPDGRLRVQVRPGQWQLTLVARRNTPATRVERPDPAGGVWKDGDEVWVFEARPALRVVTVEGVPGIDPQQTTLPDDWRSLPAYVMARGAAMTLHEQRRGDAEPAPDQLTLQRRLWLDFDGGGFTARDEIAGTLHRAWRLTMGAESRLGRVAISGADQFITRLDEHGGEGVEIRQRTPQILAESRIPDARWDIPAVGWDHDFQSASATLSLPPGWRLFHAFGADTVSSTWLKGWTLLDLFLLLITGIGIGKLYGARAGALAIAALALTFPERDAPKWAWLAVLVTEALVRALRAGAALVVLRRLTGLARIVAWVVLIVVAIPFAVREVRVGLHPSLENEERGVNFDVMQIGAAYERAAPTPMTAGSATRAGFDKGLEAAPTEAKPEVDRDGDGIPDAKDMIRKRGEWAGKGKVAHLESTIVPNQAAYDPSVVVQTGPGVPAWSWREVSFGWNGPVERTQRLRLWLIPPRVNLVLGLLRVALLASLALRLLGGWRRLTGGAGPGAPAVAAPAAIAVVLLLATAAPAHAEGALPSTEVLDELRTRLTSKPLCDPHCASIGRLSLEAVPDRLRLKFEVGADAATAVPLPGNAQHWLPSSVSVDGHSAKALHRAEDGGLWVYLAAGGHQIVMEGPLPARDVVQIPFPLKPHAVTTSAHGWRIEGLTEEGEAEESLQLTRETRATGGARAGLEAASLPPFATVERTLVLGLKWTATTRIVRQTPAGAAVVLEVPLLPGESIIAEGVHVVKGKARVNLGAEETETSWISTLAQQGQITLEAPAADRAGAGAGAAGWSETWIVQAGPLWHLAFSGIPPAEPPASGTERAPVFRPWPGDKVTIAVSRPSGTNGQTLTIDLSRLELRPGTRSTDATLTVNLRGSRGGQHTITLPEGAVLERVAVNGTPQPLRQDGRNVTIPIAPGPQILTVGWRDQQPLGNFYRAPTVDLGVPGVNSDVQIAMASDRWVLWVGGPRLGPAVLFWSLAVVLVLVGAALGRTRLTPLGTRQWALLGIGLAQTSIPAAAVVAGFLLALGWRQRRDAAIARAWVYDLGQIGFMIWIGVAAAVLLSGVEQGLVAQPDMRVAGNGSSSELLHWFSDRTAGPLARPWVVSAPLLVYRLVMLAWSLWLALAVIRWARWIWGCFSARGLWAPLRPPPAPAMPPPLPPPPPPVTEPPTPPVT